MSMSTAGEGRGIVTLRTLVDGTLTSWRARGIAHDAVWSVVVNAAGAGIAFGTQALAARALGVSNYGQYLIVLAAMNTVMLFGKLEMDSVAVRFVSAYAARGEWGLLSGFLRFSGRTVVFASAAIALSSAAIVVFAPGVVTPALRPAYLVACAILPLLALQLLFGGYMQGLHRFLGAQVPNVVLRPLLFAVLLAAAWWSGGTTLGVTTGLALNLLAIFITITVAAVLLWRALPPQLEGVVRRGDKAEWIRTSGGLLWTAVAQTALSQTFAVLILGHLSGTVGVAHYSVAGQLGALILFVPNALVFVARPRMASLFAAGEHAALQRLISQVVRASALTAVPVFLGLVVLGRPLLGIFGPGFQAAYPLVLIIGIAATFAATFGIVTGYLLNATGHQGQVAWVESIAGILHLGLSFALTWYLGALGTALAVAALMFGKHTTLMYLVRRDLGLRISAR